MPRPSLKEQRTDEILDAFERCIPRYGLEGASLERIAEEAGVQRTIIRHYIGNRDALFAALAERVMRKFYASTEELFSYLPAERRLDTLLELMLDYEHSSDANELLVFESLVAAAPRHPKLAEQLRGWVDYFVDRVADEVRASYPDRARRQCWTVAYAIVALYFNLDALAPLQLDDRYRTSSRDAAERLLASLER